MMCEDYDRLIELLDGGNVVVCYVDYVYDSGEKKTVYRDVAKAKATERYRQGTPNYGYIVEARGIRYIEWDNRKESLRGITFKNECEKLRLQFIEHADY